MAKRLSISTKEKEAPIIKRFIAFLVDLFVLNFVVVMPFRSLISSIIPKGDFSSVYAALESNPNVAVQLSQVYLIIGLLSFVYFTVCEYKIHQTLGKLLFGLYVRSEGPKLGLLQAMVRNIFLIPIFPLILLWFIEPVFILLHPKHRRLLELLSKTKVVYYETQLLP
ncbi:hypothetical protein DRJ48_00055 [Candidatus Woesearchaeota archaeon]|nr:MAG: hypothetical protein DRJ48_00055 [Candidatus Woesearchaeota archaeon]